MSDRDEWEANGGPTDRMYRDGIVCETCKFRVWPAPRVADTALAERVAQITAHRAVGSEEHSPENGKIHGYCAVCLAPWPCAFAGTPPVISTDVPLTVPAISDWIENVKRAYGGGDITGDGNETVLAFEIHQLCGRIVDHVRKNESVKL